MKGFRRVFALLILPLMFVGIAAGDDPGGQAVEKLNKIIEDQGGKMTEFLDLSGPSLNGSKSLLSEMAPAVTPLLKDLERVRVRGYELKVGGKQIEEIMDQMESELSRGSWKPIMKTLSTKDEAARALFVLEDGGKTIGLLAIRLEKGYGNIVNLVGSIDMSKIGNMGMFFRSGEKYEYAPATPDKRAWVLPPFGKFEFEIPEAVPLPDQEALRRKLDDVEKTLQSLLDQLEKGKSEEWRKKAIESIEKALQQLRSETDRKSIVWFFGKPGSNSYLGVRITDLTPEQVEKLRTSPYKQGAVVGKVYVGSPADSAGIMEGDVIVEIDGSEIKGAKAVVEKIATHDPGDKVTIKIIRNGNEKEITVKIGEKPMGLGGSLEIIEKK